MIQRRFFFLHTVFENIVEYIGRNSIFNRFLIDRILSQSELQANDTFFFLIFIPSSVSSATFT